MYSFFSRYYTSVHQVKDPSEWLALCACEADRHRMLDLIDEDNARLRGEARQCFLDGIQLGALIRCQEPDGL